LGQGHIQSLSWSTRVFFNPKVKARKVHTFEHHGVVFMESNLVEGNLYIPLPRNIAICSIEEEGCRVAQLPDVSRKPKEVLPKLHLKATKQQTSQHN
jgi:hypothetical protein